MPQLLSSGSSVFLSPVLSLFLRDSALYLQSLALSISFFPFHCHWFLIKYLGIWRITAASKVAVFWISLLPAHHLTLEFLECFTCLATTLTPATFTPTSSSNTHPYTSSSHAHLYTSPSHNHPYKLQLYSPLHKPQSHSPSHKSQPCSPLHKPYIHAHPTTSPSHTHPYTDACLQLDPCAL